MCGGYPRSMTNPVVHIGHYLLAYQPVYDLYQNLVGGVRYRSEIVKRLASSGKSAYLDLGCGTATAARALGPSINYVGLDNSENYLKNAKKEFPEFTFLNRDLGIENWDKDIQGIGDAVASGLGLLHHLDDAKARNFLETCRKSLDKESILFTVDPVIVEDTGQIAKWFAKNDRGKFIRTPNNLEKMFKQAGFSTEIEVKKGKFRIPLDTVEIVAIPI